METKFHQWHIVKVNPKDSSVSPTKFAFGVLLDDQTIDQVVAYVIKQEKYTWKWVVAASIIEPPLNSGYEITSQEAVIAAEKAIVDYGSVCIRSSVSET